MAYRLADEQPLWPKPATVNRWVYDIVQHPAGIMTAATIHWVVRSSCRVARIRWRWSSAPRELC
jgi:hypothetical protein